MKSLAYSSSEFGTQIITQPFSGEMKWISNDTYYGTWTGGISSFSHLRTGKSSNRRRFLSGTSQPWRDPSSYTRIQGKIVCAKTTDLKMSRFWYHENRPLDSFIIANAWPSNSQEPLSWWPGFDTLSSPGDSSYEMVNATNMARTKALNDLSGAKAQLGESLATYRQTADLFVDTAKTLLKFALKIKSGRLVKDLINMNPARVYDGIANGTIPKAVANRWLQFHYGWKPLASDLYGVYELLQEQLKSNPAMLVHGRGKARLNGNGTKLCPGVYTGPTRRVGVEFACQAEAGVIVNLTGRVQEAGISRMLNQAGLVNPLSLAWELTPFSFVVDWIAPVGGVLNALSATAGLDFQGGCETTRFYRKISASTEKEASMDNMSISCDLLTSGFRRKRLTNWPAPAIYVKPFYTGGDRWATIGSLLTNFLQFRK